MQIRARLLFLAYQTLEGNARFIAQIGIVVATMRLYDSDRVSRRHCLALITQLPKVILVALLARA
jgi:hypothetical protein